MPKARKPAGGYFEEYRCGCVSSVVKSQKQLLGYCPKHGADRRAIFPDISETPARHVEKRDKMPDRHVEKRDKKRDKAR